MSWDVDVIIPVHRADRAVGRAVASVLDHTQLRVRATVITHRLAPSQLADYPALAGREAVRFLQCDDAFPSAAAPRNLGLAAVEAKWVASVDSDDWLAPGALDHWVATGSRLDAAAVVPRHRRQGGGVVRTPPTRPGARVLDPVKDRLVYRVGHLGLTRRTAITELGLRYAEGLPVGEDLFFSYPLWFSGRRIVADRGPAYIVGDLGDHTSTGRAADVELASLDRYLTSPQWQALPDPARLAVAVKFLRGQIMSAITARSVGQLADSTTRAHLQAAIRQVEAAVPAARAHLSVADNAVLTAVLDPAATGEQIAALAARRRATFMRPAGLRTPRLRHLWHRDSPLRFAGASALVR
ncbi:glycosyltransferase family A protein [Buchananella hordeovulneris]|uniref:glycosyltransferase family A protein n=1 Tax=Buchananella hordeovulneris TaxID=52770 RepID=UPI0026DAE5D9|nr:glycosyltransferase family A protein [Buchananella hordeovulneris]MDO5079968.1 glycosyltransferase family A protein [Buchananella hordeovulneris]